LTCEYLREFSKKFETVLTGYSGAGAKLIHEKTRSRKSRNTVPLNISFYTVCWNKRILLLIDTKKIVIVNFPNIRKILIIYCADELFDMYAFVTRTVHNYPIMLSKIIDYIQSKR
jgi:hypothetical protein